MDATQLSFVVLYSGRTIADARIVAASSAPDLIKLAAEKMLRELREKAGAMSDPALVGRRRALRAAKAGAK